MSKRERDLAAALARLAKAAEDVLERSDVARIMSDEFMPTSIGPEIGFNCCRKRKLIRQVIKARHVLGETSALERGDSA